jgi:hypothetical protein
MRQWSMRWSEDPKVDLAIRLGVAIPLAGLGLVNMVIAARSAGLGAVGFVLIAAACFIGAGIAVAPWVAARLGNAAAGIIYPDRHFDRPQPVFSHAEAKRAQGLPREALAEYERVLAEHPEEVRCYIAMMDVAGRDLRDPTLAEGYYRRACDSITDAGALAQLRQAHDEILQDFR